MKRTAILLFFCVAALVGAALDAGAKTYVLGGRLDSTVRITKEIRFIVTEKLSELRYRLPLPATYDNGVMRQAAGTPEIRYDPRPSRVEDAQDGFGNRYKDILWTNLTRDAALALTLETRVGTELPVLESRAAFPLVAVPADVGVYLRGTSFVQSDDPAVRTLARQLTGGASTEHEAVTAIVNYVADNIRYVHNPPTYDAVSTLQAGAGNCTNIGHIALALLRASGIPARFVAGTTLDKQWRIPLGSGESVLQKIGQGGHGWIEVYFPDLGWLGYDPKQSKQFTSTRHIKETHGLDYSEIVEGWSGVPYAPGYTVRVDAVFLDDTVALVPKFQDERPRSYLYSNHLVAKAGPAVPVPPKPPAPPLPPVTPPPPVPPEPERKPGVPQAVEFGNMEFPNLVDAYTIVGKRGRATLDTETAEYVTSASVYAQAFRVDSPFVLKSVSLAMHKFGGDGTVYVDVVADDNGRPGLKGARSLPVFLDSIPRRRGYYWVDFLLPGDGGTLATGKYWIIVRRSGEAVMTWFYIPGKSYGGPEDARSTSKGYQWEDILNYDFVFKVRGEGIR